MGCKQDERLKKKSFQILRASWMQGFLSRAKSTDASCLSSRNGNTGRSMLMGYGSNKSPSSSLFREEQPCFKLLENVEGSCECVGRLILQVSTGGTEKRPCKSLESPEHAHAPKKLEIQNPKHMAVAMAQC